MWFPLMTGPESVVLSTAIVCATVLFILSRLN
jgi:hypothetical protein